MRAGGRSDDAGSSDALAHEVACRSRASETISVDVLRRDGAGDYELAVTYAG